jgi:asparagine synthase (glutamine-hydrolysing)
MCGIAGFCDFSQNFSLNQDTHLQTLINMRKAIAHRGHDQTGEFLREHVGLSHTRLSIRDIINGVQPMIKKRNNVEYAIVYNGEVYNTDELTADLRKRGYEFETTCDTEAILYTYMEYGSDCVKYLNGIFAFAVWDGLKNELFLARDRVGVKPLFYSIKNGTLVFGSEIKALLENPIIEPELDLDSFRQIFGIGPARTQGCGVFKNIYEIKAGHCAIFNKDRLHEQKYWDIISREHSDSYEKTVETVSYLVRDSIKIQMVSDVPVCSFLSGGIDSSIVTAIAADIMKKNGAVFNTYSFDFAGNDRYFTSNSFQPERDRPYVDIMLSHIDVNHTYLQCDETLLIDLLREAMLAKDLPGMADVDASLLYFCRLVKKQNKVALTGECADEIFGGYPWFYRDDLMLTDGFPWSKKTAVREYLLQDEFTKKLDLESYIRNQYEETIKQVLAVEGETPLESRRREIAFLNIKWFMTTLLDRMDRASMYSGLEARVPFADHRIIEYVFNVPWEMKRRNGIEKFLLRDAFKDVLPAELLNRKKSPYPKTYNPEYEALLKKKLTSIMQNHDAPVHAFIDVKKAQSFMESPSEYGDPWFGQLMAAPQLLAYMIQVNEWLETYNPKITLS